MPERNAAISYLMKNAVKGKKPDIWIDYPAVKVARGNLPPPKDTNAERSSDDSLVIQWSHNTAFSNKRASDKVLALAYFPETKGAVWSVDGAAVRADEELTLKLSESAAQKEMHLYLAFADQEGKDASDSVYLGKG